MNFKRYLKSGATLIEVAVATALLAIIGGAMISLVLQAQAVNTSAALNNQATHFAEQLVEQVIYTSETNRKAGTWATNVSGKVASPGPCWTDGTFATPAPNGCTAPTSTSCPANFTAVTSPVVQLTQVNTNTVQATATIYYRDKSQCRSVNSTTYVTNYK